VDKSQIIFRVDHQGNLLASELADIDNTGEVVGSPEHGTIAAGGGANRYVNTIGALIRLCFDGNPVLYHIGRDDDGIIQSRLIRLRLTSVSEERIFAEIDLAVRHAERLGSLHGLIGVIHVQSEIIGLHVPAQTLARERAVATHHETKDNGGSVPNPSQVKIVVVPLGLGQDVDPVAGKHGANVDVARTGDAQGPDASVHRHLVGFGFGLLLEHTNGIPIQGDDAADASRLETVVVASGEQFAEQNDQQNNHYNHSNGNQDMLQNLVHRVINLSFFPYHNCDSGTRHMLIVRTIYSIETTPCLNAL